jgi:hypothetical protein
MPSSELPSLRLRVLSRVLLPQFFELGGCVFVRHVASERLFRAAQAGGPHTGSWNPDRTGAEVFENHLHPLDLFAQGLSLRMSDPAFRSAELLGQAIAHSWFSHLVRAFPGQRFRIYYSRSNHPTVRFHRCYRGEPSWLDEAAYAKDVARGHLLVLETPGRAA